MTAAQSNVDALPGAALDVAKMPGHWLLARLGKRVLAMRKVFQAYSENIAAIYLIASKPSNVA